MKPMVINFSDVRVYQDCSISHLGLEFSVSLLHGPDADDDPPPNPVTQQKSSLHWWTDWYYLGAGGGGA